MTEKDAVKVVANRFRNSYCVRGRWIGWANWRGALSPKQTYLQIKRLTSLNAVDKVIGNRSWTQRIRGWRNKDRVS